MNAPLRLVCAASLGLAIAGAAVAQGGGGGGGGSGAPSNNPPSANTNNAGNVQPGGAAPGTVKGESKPMRPMRKASGEMTSGSSAMPASAPMKK